MTKEELEKEAGESWWNDNNCSGALSTKKIYICGYLAGAEPREKRITEQEELLNSTLEENKKNLQENDRLRHGLKIAQSKDWFIVWDKKTGIPVNYSLPFVTEMNKDYENTIFYDWLASIKASDYRRPFMTEEEVKAFNEETKQHLKDRLKVIDEKIKLNKDKPVNFPKGDIEYKSEIDNEIN